MGLDMFLMRRTYIQHGNNDPSKKLKVIVTYGDEPYTGIDAERIMHIDEEVGYWRKANAIHGWFVRHVQNGVDDCEEHHVNVEDLRELLTTVDEVLLGIRDAEVSLPTEEGFFFGSTDYNEYYRHTLEHTKKIIEPLMNESGDAIVSYFYRASW